MALAAGVKMASAAKALRSRNNGGDKRDGIKAAA
jgi:hypothetical protein